MSVYRIRTALDLIDANPREGFLAELEAELTGSWAQEDEGASAEGDVPMVGAVLPHRPHLIRRPALVAAAVLAVLALGLLAVIAVRDPAPERIDTFPTPATTAPATTTPRTSSTPSGSEASAAFLGQWRSRDASSRTQTMDISGADDGSVVMTLHAAASSSCAAGAATITGAGRVSDSGVLEVSVSGLACDDGSELAVPAPAVTAYTLSHDPTSDTLTDGSGVVWARDGSGPGGTVARTSGGMWPQSNEAEVAQAQSLADAGDPAYTWQVDPGLVSLGWWDHLGNGGSQIVARFMREQLGWEQFVFNPFTSLQDNIEGDNEGDIRNVVFLRCAAGRTNPLYPEADDSGIPGGGHQCAPTIDDFRYEAVSLDLAQPTRRVAPLEDNPQAADGIWVVRAWRMAAPFTQVDPSVVEDDARARLEAFLQARVDGSGAEGKVVLRGKAAIDEVPLLYATSTGARYERYEIERTRAPRWPDGSGLDFTVRLYADGGRTVVEQEIRAGAELTLAQLGTTENGRPIDVPYRFFGGKVTALAPPPWKFAFEYNAALVLGEDNYSERNIEVALDPVAATAGCEAGEEATDAAALATSISADPNLVTTQPVITTIGGATGVVMDVTVAPGAGGCLLVMAPGRDSGYSPRRDEGTLAAGSRMRLFLLDLPEGWPERVLAIAVVAPSERFDQVLEAAAPVIESIRLRS